jgi:hypothetical protein
MLWPTVGYDHLRWFKFWQRSEASASLKEVLTPTLRHCHLFGVNKKNDENSSDGLNYGRG